ncbi:MAG TPA: aldo/keto reductase [Candidatus Binatia bacterium]|nr:aldo/keto reductase [Candidatus Binatia bacterium]
MNLSERRARLGASDVEVTRLGFGAAPIGNLFAPVADRDAAGAVDAAWRSGIRFFDTAPLYGHGLSEKRIGAALRAHRREEFVLATKVGRLLVPDESPPDHGFVETSPFRPVFDFSFDATLRALDESLARLGTDRVDVLHVHDPDDHVDDALRGAFRALRRLRDDRVVRAIGGGMNRSAPLARFVREAGVDCVLLAGRYTLLDQSALDDLLPACVASGVSVIAGGVFNSGLLADPSPRATYDYAPAPPPLVARARRLAAVCARHGVDLKAAALRFPRAHPAVACVLTGARTAAEMAQNARLFAAPIPLALWDDLRRERLLDDRAPTPEAEREP